MNSQDSYDWVPARPASRHGPIPYTDAEETARHAAVQAAYRSACSDLISKLDRLVLDSQDPSEVLVEATNALHSGYSTAFDRNESRTIREALRGVDGHGGFDPRRDSVTVDGRWRKRTHKRTSGIFRDRAEFTFTFTPGDNSSQQPSQCGQSQTQPGSNQQISSGGQHPYPYRVALTQTVHSTWPQDTGTDHQGRQNRRRNPHQDSASWLRVEEAEGDIEFDPTDALESAVTDLLVDVDHAFDLGSIQADAEPFEGDVVKQIKSHSKEICECAIG
ncbi:hypothetical protein IAT40_005822 [Kwoniella sp. CBS 6097]